MGLLGSILSTVGRVLLGDVRDASATDIMELKFEELRAAARPLFSGANKRIDRLRKAELTFTPALDSVEMSGGKFYISSFVHATQINALRAEVFRAREFILMKTSTVSAARKYDAHMKEVMSGLSTTAISQETASAVWSIYRKAEEENFLGVQRYGSDNVVSVIYESIETMDEDAILKLVRDSIRAEYETAEEAYEASLAEDAGFII